MPRKKRPNKSYAPGGLYSGMGYVKPGKSGWYIWYEGQQVDGPYMDRVEAKIAREWYGSVYKVYYKDKTKLKIGADNEFREN